MKKIRFAALATILTFTLVLTGCPDPSNPATGGAATTQNGGSTGNGGNSNTSNGGSSTTQTLQSQIDAATAGTTVTLNSAYVSAGSTIVINKALTVDGNNIENLTVKVSPEVSSAVTLKNFKKATIKVEAATSRSARGADDREPAAGIVGGEGQEGPSGTTDEDAALKRFGDDVMPLYLEGCTIDKLEAEDDFSLYLGSGDDKTVIEELRLKEGVKDFTFIEFDEEATDTADKSKVENFRIDDDGIEEINLIGGTFGDVDFADNFAGEIDFKYDREFEDQFEKADFMKEDFIKERDVAIADNVADTNESGIYKIEINKEDFKYLNGCVSVVFLKDEQVAMLQPTNGMPAAANKYAFCTPELPLYAMSIAGDFGIELEKTGLSTVYGSESAIFKPTWNKGICYFKTVAFETYPVYSKEAVIADVGDKTVTYYVDMNAVKKSDLIIGANTISSGPIGGPGDKLYDIDLTGYKAYFAVDARKMFAEFNRDPVNVAAQEAFAYEGGGYAFFADGIPYPDGQEGFVKNPYITTEALKSSHALGMDGNPIDIPVYDSVQFESGMPYFYFFTMDEADAYPAGAATATEASIEVEDLEYLDVYYCDAEGNKKTDKATKVLVRNINPKCDDFDYFTDDKLTEYIDGGYGGEGVKTLYARPVVKIEVWEIGSNGMQFRGDRIACIDDGQIYTSYDPATSKLDGRISKNELAASANEGDIVYVNFSK